MSICWMYQEEASGASPANTTRGVLLRAEIVSAVMIWVKPGPQVVEATPTLPVARA